VACLEAVVASGASLSPVAMHNPRHGGRWMPHESGHGAAVYVVFNQLSLSIVMFLKEEFRVDRNQRYEELQFRDFIIIIIIMF
jgi:hypothetical protein